MIELDLKQKKDTRPEEDRTGFSTFENPPQDLKDSEEQIQEVEARFKRQEIKLTTEEREHLNQELKVIVDGWKQSRSGLQTKLREWNDLHEGVTTITDFPWIGSSHIHVPLPKIKGREIRSTINRSILRPIPFLVTQYSGPDVMRQDNVALARSIEQFVEDKIKNATNVHRVLKESLIPTYRDGTCPIQITWETTWERVFDYKTYNDELSFLEDYPGPEEAGVSPEQYQNITAKLVSGQSHEVRYEYDVATYDGPKAHIVPLIDFVHYPVYVPELDETICHGKRIWLTDYQIVNLFNQKKFSNKEQVETLVAGSSDTHDDDYTASKDRLEGIDRQTQAMRQGSKEFEFFELVLLTAIKKPDRERGIRRKYLINYHHKTNQSFRIESYPVRKGRPVYFLSRFIKRDNRLLGMSLVDDISDLSEEIDILHRQRINSRTITHVPTFKAKGSAKDRFDPSNRNLRFQPGRVYWLRNMDDVQQFDIRPVDLSGSVDEELLLFQLVDMVTGSSSGLSGQANPIDPRAPARKEAQLLRQSTNRLDDYAEPLIDTYTKIGQHFMDLYYQYGPNRIKFFAKTEENEIIEQEIERSKLFNPNVLFNVHSTSIFSNPEQEFSRNMEIYQILGQDPITAKNPRIRRNALDRVLTSSRIPDEKDLLPLDQEIGVDSGGQIPSLEDKEFQIKQTLQQQKAADRLKDSKARAQAALDQETLRQVGNIETASLKVPPGGPAPGGAAPGANGGGGATP